MELENTATQPSSYHESSNREVKIIIDKPNPTSIEKVKQLSLDLEAKLPMPSLVQSRPSIYRVHNELRNIKSKAYEPNLVAIGPYHSDKENLKMESHKLRFLHNFLDRERKCMKDCVLIMERLEPKVREYYAEPINLDSIDFIGMLVLDACFILEFALQCKYEDLRGEDDPIFNMAWMSHGFTRDLMLFENQIPFVVICELFDFINGQSKYGDLTGLILNLFEPLYPLKVYEDNFKSDPTNVQHLLELIHKSLILTYKDLEFLETWIQMHKLFGKPNLGQRRQDFISSASRLAEFNVKFKCSMFGDSMFRIGLENGTMRLPRLQIEDETESLLRNLIAFEQYSRGNVKWYVTDFAVLMDRLINSEEDVKKLMKYDIIENLLGSEKDVVDIFNKLTDNVMMSANFIYKWHFKNVIEHCNQRRHAWMAKLTRNHLNSPWAIISIIAAFVLLALTIVQTVFTIIM